STHWSAPQRPPSPGSQPTSPRASPRTPHLREARNEVGYGYGSRREQGPAPTPAPRCLQTLVVHACGGIPAGRAQLGARLPDPSHGASPKVTRRTRANSDQVAGTAGGQSADLRLRTEGHRSSYIEI